MLDASKERDKEAVAVHNEEASNREALMQQLVLKLAFLELCGWIEITLDDIYLSIGKTKIETGLIERHINKCYSFNSQSLISNLKYCLGEDKYKLLKGKCENSNEGIKYKNTFLKTLDNLSEYRNQYAHTCFDITALPGGQLGIDEIYKNFIYLLKVLNRLDKYLGQINN